MTYPELLVLRHGETEWNAQGRMQGHLDSPLTARGRAQALHQGALLRAYGLEGFSALSSPLGRAFHTAALALGGLIPEIHTDPRLREIGMGEWQGMDQAEVIALTGEGDWLDEPFAFYARARGAEGFAALAQRCHAVLDQLTGPTVLVTHGITSRMLRLIVLGGDPHDIGQLHALPGGQGVVYRLMKGEQTRLE